MSGMMRHGLCCGWDRNEGKGMRLFRSVCNVQGDGDGEIGHFNHAGRRGTYSRPDINVAVDGNGIA